MNWEEFKENFNISLNKGLIEEFISTNPDWQEILNVKIDSKDRIFVFLILKEIKQKYIQPFFDQLVFYACVGNHITIRNSTEVIFRLDQSWVVRNIKKPIKEILSTEHNSEVYLNLFTLLIKMKERRAAKIALEIARKAIKDDDSAIREAGQWAIDTIEKHRGEIILSRDDFVKQLEQDFISNVTFIMDYLAIGFNVGVLTALIPPKILVGSQSWIWGQPGYNDQLISLIQSKVNSVDLNEDKNYFRLILENEVELLIDWNDPDLDVPEVFILNINSELLVV